MTLGSVARVAMEYRQHLQMLNNISKLTVNLSADSKVAKLGSPTCDPLPTMEKLNLDKLLSNSKYGSTALANQNIPGFPTGNSLFDLASLMLFGTHALPVRLKILLDRLLCTLEHDELVNLLHAFGWTYEDYSRGYMLQDSIGNILTKWIIVSKEEEIYIIQLFLKFPETKTIAQNFVLTESIFNQYSDGSAILGSKLKDYELKKLVDCTNAALLPTKNSLLNLNSLKSPVSELSSHNAKSQYENKSGKLSNHHHHHSGDSGCGGGGGGRETLETDKATNRLLKSSVEESDKQQTTGSLSKQTSSKMQLSPLNHFASTSPKSEKNKDKCQSNSQSPLAAPFNSLSKLENLVPPFEYRKKENKSNSEPATTTDPSQYLASSVSVSAPSIANPLFSLANPLSNFSPLLNPALLADPSKYPNAAELCKIDLTNPATAAAAAAALNKNIDFSSFKAAAEGVQTNNNTAANNCPSGNDVMNLTQNSKHVNSDSSSSNHHGHHHHHGHHSQRHEDKKVNKHLRKSNNPIKRRWDPLILSSLTTNPTTGKKRVQCNVCLKTFCDKGALKIHFSAVHLREMHKCTVDGCNMMFSSRRSRNRHSANPNPKLHTPNFRRKINPHDGRTANPYPIIPGPPGTLFGLTGVNGNLMGNFDGLKGNYSEHSPKGDFAIDFNSVSSHSSRTTPNEELMDDTYSDEEDNNTNKDVDDDNDLDGDDDICIDLSLKDDTLRNSRKRKNLKPIKFSMNGNGSNNNNNNNNICANDVDHDDDSSEQYQYLSTDDEDDDDDISSDGDVFSSKRIRHDDSADQQGSDDESNNKPRRAHEDNDAETDIDVEEGEVYSGGAANRTEQSRTSSSIPHKRTAETKQHDSDNSS